MLRVKVEAYGLGSGYPSFKRVLVIKGSCFSLSPFLSTS